MKYALLLTDDEIDPPTDDELGVDPVHRRWIDHLRSHGGMIAGARLRPSATATTVRVREGRTLVCDGPFTETKDIIGGIVLIECDDLDEAIEIARGHPYARRGSVEIRPVQAFTDDLGPAE